MTTSENEPTQGTPADGAREATPAIEVYDAGEGTISMIQRGGAGITDTTRRASLLEALTSGRLVVTTVTNEAPVLPLADQPGAVVSDSGRRGINVVTDQPIGLRTPTGQSAISEAFRTGRTVSVTRTPAVSTTGAGEQAPAQSTPPAPQGGK